MKKTDEFWNMDSPLWAVIMRRVYAFVAVAAWVSILCGQWIDLLFAIPFTIMALHKDE